MTDRAERWKRLEQLCHSVLDRVPVERESYLRQACGDDEALRKAVERLLAGESTAKHFLEADVGRDWLPHAVAAGDCLGDYIVISRIGAGGMGEVYLARDARLGRDVAIKIVSEGPSNQESVRRLTREAQAIAALNHPNILTIFDVATTVDDVPFIVTEFVEGDTLAARIDHGPVPLGEVVELAMQIVCGLVHAHDARIVHRDLKPQNIMVKPDGLVKILDFSLGKWLSTSPPAGSWAAHDYSDPQTSAGTILGTVGYMSPEQVTGEPVDTRSDQFAFGAVLFELLTGRRAFNGTTTIETIARILLAEPGAILEDAPATPAALVSLVERCLAKKPDDRYPSTRTLAGHLDAIRASLRMDTAATQRWDDTSLVRAGWSGGGAPGGSAGSVADTDDAREGIEVPERRAHRFMERAQRGALNEIGANGVIDQATLDALEDLDARVRGHGRPVDQKQDARDLVVRHGFRATTGNEYRLTRVAAWTDARYGIDTRFTRLTLLLDQGRAQAPRWDAQPSSFDDLRAAMDAAREAGPALVLLGPPGSGKSTLLRRLDYDLAVVGVQEGSSDASFAWFVSLARFQGRTRADAAPNPMEWLASQWAAEYPCLPRLHDIMRSGRLVLLLDALNEVPHAGPDDYRWRVSLWREFVVDVSRRSPGVRVIFSCRSLDYSESLSTPELTVPHVRIERLSDDQVEAFLTAHRPDAGSAIWAALCGTLVAELFRSPFYLKLLLAQTGPAGELPPGRAALFTAFARQVLTREVQRRHRLFQPGTLLSTRDHQRVVQGEWRSAWDLSCEPLSGALSLLALGLQRQGGSEVSLVRARLDEALRLLGGEAPHLRLEAGVALQLLDDDRQRDEVSFVHQLVQEYFAARAVAATPDGDIGAVAALAAVPWRQADMPPVHFENDNDPLPLAPRSGWEETFTLAAAMVSSADAFVRGVMATNLPLASRCASTPEVTIRPETRAALQMALVDRSRDREADLRSRIAAARNLGELGDPRFERCTGAHGDYLWPPFVKIPGGTYSIGSAAGEADERPVHDVVIEPFAIGQFPVTNAEWRLFMEASGYEDERWWLGDAARRWRRGERAGEGMRAVWRRDRAELAARPGVLRDWISDRRSTALGVEAWESYLAMSDADFEVFLERTFPHERHTAPSGWNDSDWNHPSFPIIGICWYEAQAYCRWVSSQRSENIRLPNEAEWEAAARGPAARRYAWGDTFSSMRANFFATVMPVGVFPDGDTPDGLVDMTGNVSEWTSSAYRPYPFNSSDVREGLSEEPAEPRVARGGLRMSDRDSERAAYRMDLEPSYRRRNGFRLVWDYQVGEVTGR